MKITPQRAIADVLFERDDLTIGEIMELSEVPLTLRQSQQILLDAICRKHVVRNAQITRAGVNRQLHVYSLTRLGRSAAPIICSPQVLLRAPQRVPRRMAVGNHLDIPPSAELCVTLPMRALRVLLSAIDTQEQPGDVREAFETAMRAARPEIVHA
jgi:hypothetical protein